MLIAHCCSIQIFGKSIRLYTLGCPDHFNSKTVGKVFISYPLLRYKECQESVLFVHFKPFHSFQCEGCRKMFIFQGFAVVCRFVEKFSLLYTLGCPDHFNLKTVGRMFNSYTLLWYKECRKSVLFVHFKPFQFEGCRKTVHFRTLCRAINSFGKVSRLDT